MAADSTGDERRSEFLDELFGLSGEVAVVGGGTGILGGVIAEYLGAAGAKVAVAWSQPGTGPAPRGDDNGRRWRGYLCVLRRYRCRFGCASACAGAGGVWRGYGGSECGWRQPSIGGRQRRPGVLRSLAWKPCATISISI